MDLKDYTVRPSKHFIKGWMRKWDYDIEGIKDGLAKAYKIEKVGKNKYEAYIREKNKSRKIIFTKQEKEIFIITGAEGK